MRDCNRLRESDDEDDGPDAWDDPDLDDDPDADDHETEPCPYCRAPVYDDAERCPSCGRYLSREDRPWSRPWWVVVGVVLCLVVVARWIFF